MIAAFDAGALIGDGNLHFVIHARGFDAQPFAFRRIFQRVLQQVLKRARQHVGVRIDGRQIGGDVFFDMPIGKRGFVFDERLFDVHVDVFQLGLELEVAGFDLRFDLLECLANLVALVSRDQADFGQHQGMSNRALDIMGIEAVVEAHAFGEPLDAGVRPLGENSTAGRSGQQLPLAGSWRWPENEIESQQLIYAKWVTSNCQRASDGAPTSAGSLFHALMPAEAGTSADGDNREPARFVKLQNSGKDLTEKDGHRAFSRS